MSTKNRWMAWILEESACSEVTMPWARGTQPNWKKRLTEEAPDLAKILQNALTDTPSGIRNSGLSRQITS